MTDSPNTAEATDEETVVVVPAFAIVCLTAADVLVLKLTSPGYTTVIEWVSTVRLDVANVATTFPLTTLSVPVPSVVAPSRKVTVPAAVFGVTVAVKVTGAWCSSGSRPPFRPD